MRIPALRELRALFENKPVEPESRKTPRQKKFDVGIDKDDPYYRRINATNKHEVSPYLLERARGLSIRFYSENSIAARIIDIPIEAMKSAGMRIIAEDERAQECVNDFWGDDVYGFSNLFWDFFKGGGITGELHLPAHTIPGTAIFEVALIDTQNVVEVNFKETNALVRESILVKVKTQKQQFEILNKGMMYSPKTYRGDTFSFFYNLPMLNFKRGIPTLFSSIDYIDLLEQYMFNETERSSTLRMFVWEFILKNKTEDECRAWYDEHFEDGKPPAPQSVHVHNSNVEMKAVSPELRAGEIKDFSRTLRNHITGGLGYPEFFFGWGDSTNYATAREQNLPASWKIEGQQGVFVRTLSPIIAFRLEEAKRNRYVTTKGVMDDSTSTKFKIVMKPVIPRDLVRYSTVLSTILGAMSTAIDKKIIPRRVAVEMTASILEYFGMDYDANVIEAELDKELAKSKPKEKEVEPVDDSKKVDDELIDGERNADINLNGGFHFIHPENAFDEN